MPSAMELGQTGLAVGWPPSHVGVSLDPFHQGQTQSSPGTVLRSLPSHHS